MILFLDASSFVKLYQEEAGAVIECPGADTAARVRSPTGKHVEPITATLLRVNAQGKERAALVKRLREKGIFVSG